MLPAVLDAESYGRESALTCAVTRNRRVLVVDDDRPVRKLMATMAAGSGYETFEAEDGTEAIRVAEAEEIDLLITDIEMPGMSGPELIDILRKRGYLGRSLLVSGNTAAASFHNSVPLLAKPFTCGQLLKEIHTILND